MRVVYILKSIYDVFLCSFNSCKPAKFAKIHQIFADFGQNYAGHELAALRHKKKLRDCLKIFAAKSKQITEHF